MAAGHNNVAAVGTTDSNQFYTTNFQSTYRLGNSHAQVSVLKDNLRTYRSITPSYLWTSVPSLAGNTSNTFDSDTDANLKTFQQNEGLTDDGIYGAESRNSMHRMIGVSPESYVRVFKSTAGYTNYNDTTNGLSGDSKFKLDYSWVTSTTRDTLYSLGYSFYQSYSKKIEINDCSLIDGALTPEHQTHRSGKEIDVRNYGMTAAQEKKFLELCVANSNVRQVIFYTNHGLTSSKIKVDAKHNDHFHVDTNN